MVFLWFIQKCTYNWGHSDNKTPNYVWQTRSLAAPLNDPLVTQSHLHHSPSLQISGKRFTFNKKIQKIEKSSKFCFFVIFDDFCDLFKNALVSGTVSRAFGQQNVELCLTETIFGDPTWRSLLTYTTVLTCKFGKMF